MEKYACILTFDLSHKETAGVDVDVNILYAWIIPNEFKWFVMFWVTILSLCGTPVVPRTAHFLKPHLNLL